MQMEQEEESYILIKIFFSFLQIPFNISIVYVLYSFFK